MIMKLASRLSRACSLALMFQCTLTTISLQADETMKPTSTEQTAFEVIGIEVRTNNAAEAGADGEIPKLWQRLFMEGLLSRIPSRADESIVAVYTKYASDATGDYTFILGAKVAPGTKAPEGMVAVSIPAGTYLEFISAKGAGQDVVPPLWRQIYGYFQGPGIPPRAFQTDFERYDGPFDPNSMQAHIYIGVK